jgi:RNA polymerase sigma-70 factor (ECF subfamily)
MEVENYKEKLSEKAIADYKLISEAKKGDQRAFTKLLSKYRTSVFCMINRMVKNRDDAEDITMDTFGRVFKVIDEYTPNGSFSSWLFRIAANKAMDFLRANRQKTVSIDRNDDENDSNNIDYVPDLIGDVKNPEEKLISSQRESLLHSFVEQLPEDYKVITLMHYWDDKSYVEISKELLVPMSTVKTRLFRSRELLMSIMRDNAALSNVRY